MKKIAYVLSKGLHTAAQIILGIMMLLITFDVLGRWIFNKPIVGTVDFVSVGLSIVVFLSLAFTHLKGEHITIDFIVERFSTKTQRTIEVIINLVISLFLLVVTWSLVDHMLRLYRSNTVTGDLSIPVYLFAIVAIIGMAIFLLVALTQAISIVKEMKHNES